MASNSSMRLFYSVLVRYLTSCIWGVKSKLISFCMLCASSPPGKKNGSAMRGDTADPRPLLPLIAALPLFLIGLFSLGLMIMGFAIVVLPANSDYVSLLTRLCRSSELLVELASALSVMLTATLSVTLLFVYIETTSISFSKLKGWLIINLKAEFI